LPLQAPSVYTIVRDPVIGADFKAERPLRPGFAIEFDWVAMNRGRCEARATMFTRISGLTLIALAASCMSRGAPANDQASATAVVPAAPAPAAPAPAPEATTAPPPAATAPAASAEPEAQAPSSGNAQQPPRTEAECKSKCNGSWGRHGLSPKDSCNCRTSDGGKRCRDGNECEGQCVAAENPELDVKEKGPPPLGYLVGRCSTTKTVFGCQRFIRDGASSGPPRDLSQLPPKLCVD
jgi:hypothetical protein